MTVSSLRDYVPLAINGGVRCLFSCRRFRKCTWIDDTSSYCSNLGIFLHQPQGQTEAESYVAAVPLLPLLPMRARAWWTETVEGAIVSTWARAGLRLTEGPKEARDCAYRTATRESMWFSVTCRLDSGRRWKRWGILCGSGPSSICVVQTLTRKKKPCRLFSVSQALKQARKATGKLSFSSSYWSLVYFSLPCCRCYQCQKRLDVNE